MSTQNDFQSNFLDVQGASEWREAFGKLSLAKGKSGKMFICDSAGESLAYVSDKAAELFSEKGKAAWTGLVFANVLTDNGETIPTLYPAPERDIVIDDL